MKRVVYNLTGLDGFDELLEPLKLQMGFVVESAETLAKRTVDTLVGQGVILSDERFGAQTTDEEIQAYLEGLSKIGLNLFYIGVPRETPVFARTLQTLHVRTYLSHELTEDNVQQWLVEEVSNWPAPESESEGILDEPKTDTPRVVASTPPQQTQRSEHLCVVVSGAPGTGSTFVGLNLAEFLAREGVVKYIEASMRPCLPTWLGAEDTETTASLSSPLQPAFERGNLHVYTRNPFGDEQVNLRTIATEMESWTGSTMVLDLALQDYLASIEHAFAYQTVRVLVTTSDLHRCRYLAGISADIVVINQAATRLPIDADEFQSFWPHSAIFPVPYEPEQSVAIVQGQAALHLSQGVGVSIERILAQVKGGELIETGAV